MKKSIRNMIIGAAMTIGVFAASTAAFAATQYVQTDMNFRNGPAVTSQIIGSIPAGAQVDVLDTVNGWNLVSYNGRTGYIHGGNVAGSYTAPTTTKSYYDNNWTQTAQNMNNYSGEYRTVVVESGFLALRTTPEYDNSNIMGELYTGDTVQLIGGTQGSYVRVYSPKIGTHGWVNAGFLR
ncbi:MAG: SH3 domain-containing protein [Lachnospiraceae bacterium]|nr:SH3 domain-containing protein [Lachnospiraceae bacterium]